MALQMSCSSIEEEGSVKDSDESLVFSCAVRTLQKLIPGGQDIVEVDLLFKETADYIIALERQVKFLRTLAGLYAISELDSGSNHCT
ncbi:hypothetical protein SUGI_0192580 [Cryptomeria japonica]|uniref:transcription factor PAR1 n=1 Tax=Cryptomeria japonica TaxID=3369 RepID=UPI002408A320|nr:transcription factor PAR1 [Cryptomeria japonica]GLJ12516.1 hypothetical protein SUGI_0192580 [Cryptomeria japonica]